MQVWRMEGRRALALSRIADYKNELALTYVKDSMPFEAEVFVTDERLPLKDTFFLKRRKAQQGERWGKAWQSAYYKLTCVLPKNFLGKELAVKLDLGGEILIYDEKARPLYGLTNYSAHENNYRKNIHRIGKQDGALTVYAECAANELLGIERDKKKLSRDVSDVRGKWDAVFHFAEVGLFNEDVYKLYLAVEFLSSLYSSLDPSSTRAARIITALFDSACAYPVKGAKEAFCLLEGELSKVASASALSTTVVGHAHIDTAWLWPIKETKRKVTRTFASQIENIKNYPEFKFAASSAQQYLWIKNEHPSLYAEIKQAVKEGRWEPIGAMWLEPDCNLISGESLVRQIIEGKRFFKEEFGLNVRNCWLPDAFGYPASLPQILSGADVPYFVSQKISWNAHTEFPHDTFLWKGIDGSEVIAHFLPERNYNSNGLPQGLCFAEAKFKEKDRLNEFITALGIGDGGGGPKEEHIERILRSKNAEGVPKAEFGTVSGFFERLETRKALLETYKGELYLERHRGTYTSQALMKKCNREFEEAYRILEALCVELDAKERLKPILHDGLLLQFHDILPGSSIGEVYEEAREIYKSINERFKALLIFYFEAKNFKWSAFSASFGSEARDNKKTVLSVYNFTGHTGPVLVKLGDEGVFENVSVGKRRAQKLGKNYYITLPLKAGWNSFRLDSIAPAAAFTADLELENESIKYTFNERGEIIGILDKRKGVDFLEGRVGNRLCLYSDNPQRWEAWDIDFYYGKSETEELKTVKCEKLSSSAILVVHKSEASVIYQYIYLPKEGSALYFVNEVDWQESRRLLRVYFPHPSLADEVVCDIPYGLFKRKAHVQNEEDFAKFEFCSRGFTAAFDDEKLVALASDSKYGYSASGGFLGLSLLRAPIDPDPFADLGHHEFTYAYIPALGDLDYVRAVSDALNSPSLTVLSEQGLEEDLPVIIDGVSLSVIKRSECGNALVFRAVENAGRHSRAVLHSSYAFFECDLLEENESLEAVAEGSIIEFKPFEIKTFKSK